MFYDFFEFFPKDISSIIRNKIEKENLKGLEEIRIRNNQNIIMKYSNKEIVIEHIITSNNILEMLQMICENSIYSYQKEIGQGFITVKGGHRVGISR